MSKPSLKQINLLFNDILLRIVDPSTIQNHTICRLPSSTDEKWAISHFAARLITGKLKISRAGDH